MSETTRGTTERGTAAQRHFVRAVDNEIEDAWVVCSFSTGCATVNARGNTEAVLDAAAEWGGEPSLRKGEDHAWQYPNGGAALVVSFD